MNVLLLAISTLSDKEQAQVAKLLAKAKQNLKKIEERDAAFGTQYQQTLQARYN